MNRRQFVQASAGAAAFLASSGQANAYAKSPRIRKFVDRLPIFGADIPLATPDKASYPGVDYYEIEAGVFRQQLGSQLPGRTRLYGYRQTNGAGEGTFQALGSPVLAQKDRPVRIKLKSGLPAQHILPFDSTIPSPGNGGDRQDRTAIHLHGGLVPWPSDGGPFHWISNAGNAGGFQQGASLPGTGWLPDKSGLELTNDYFYPNHQSARMMWYHDHAIGITRLNAYAGVATGYVLLDGTELGMGIPVPGDILVFQDKVFYDPALDPNYALYAGPSVLGGAQAGDLWYPYVYDPKIWKLGKAAMPPPMPSCVAEMFGDTMLVNGVPYPYQNVSGMKRYRFLNACNARFLNLSFAVENPSNPGEVKVDNKGIPVWAPVKVWQIGSEGGFLPIPVLLADTTVAGAAPPIPLLLGPAERADIIVDFSAVPIGSNVILYNGAPAPFPGGSSLFDDWTGANSAKPGFGPNTRTPLIFRRTADIGEKFSIPMPAAGSTLVPTLPTISDPVNGGLKLSLTPGQVTNFDGQNYIYLDPATQSQELTLNESFDAYGRLAQLVGNVKTAGGLLGSMYWDGPGEQVTYGTIQIWNIYNLTADVHPMHFHLFNVMVLGRRPIRVNQFAGTPIFTGAARPPEVNETGWKETVKMYPGECTTVAALIEDPFHLPDPGTGVFGGNRCYTIKTRPGGVETPATATVEGSPRLAQFGVNGDEYVWHCHILEHEEHDMMHSLVGK